MMKRPSWITKMKDVTPPRHGWKSLHFFVKGESLCGGWTSSINGYNYFTIRNPSWITEIGTDSEKLIRDCAKCTRIWLELYHIFKNSEPRLFP